MDDLIRQAREMLEGVTELPERLEMVADLWAASDGHNDHWCAMTDAIKFIAWCREGVPALIAELEKRNG